MIYMHTFLNCQRSEINFFLSQISEYTFFLICYFCFKLFCFRNRNTLCFPYFRIFGHLYTQHQSSFSPLPCIQFPQQQRQLVGVALMLVLALGCGSTLGKKLDKRCVNCTYRTYYTYGDGRSLQRVIYQDPVYTRGIYKQSPQPPLFLKLS